MPKSICRCCGRWPSLGPGRCGDESALSQSRGWLLSAESSAPGFYAQVGRRSAGKLRQAYAATSPSWTLDQRVGAQLGADACAAKLAAARAPPGGGAALRALVGRL